MKNKVCYGAFVICGLLLSVMPAVAHHSFTAEFDLNQPFTLTGTIAKVDWINPHVQIFVDVKNKDGNIERWRIASWATGVLHRAGFEKKNLVIGSEVTLKAFRAKDGSLLGHLRYIKLANGSEFELWRNGADGLPGGPE